METFINSPFRDQSGKFTKVPLGALVRKLNDKTHLMEEIYYITIGYNKGMLSTIPFTHAVTRTHTHNFPIKKGKNIAIVRMLSKKELVSVIRALQAGIMKNENPAYNDVARHAICMLKLVLTLKKDLA